LATAIANLSQDTIRTSDALNNVHVAADTITMNLNVSNVATQVVSFTANNSTNTNLAVDFRTPNEVSMVAYGTNADVDLRLSGQGTGHVIIGETGDGVLQAETGYNMTVAAGTGGTMFVTGTNVSLGNKADTPVAVFTGTTNATSHLAVTNSNTAVSVGVVGTGSNLDLVFAPKGTGSVNVSNAAVINVANATNAQDAVTLSQMTAAVTASTVGGVKTLVGTFAGTATTLALGTITGTVLRVKVLITGAYTSGSITVNSAATGDLAASSAIDEASAGLYLIEAATPVTAQAITATLIGAGLTGGSATVIVEYLQG